MQGLAHRKCLKSDRNKRSHQVQPFAQSKCPHNQILAGRTTSVCENRQEANERSLGRKATVAVANANRKLTIQSLGTEMEVIIKVAFFFKRLPASYLSTGARWRYVPVLDLKLHTRPATKAGRESKAEKKGSALEG